MEKKYNVFYENEAILTSEPAVKNLRLTLTSAVEVVLRNGLTLLGIPVIDSM